MRPGFGLWRTPMTKQRDLPLDVAVWVCYFTVGFTLAVFVEPLWLWFYMAIAVGMVLTGLVDWAKGEEDGQFVALWCCLAPFWPVWVPVVLIVAVVQHMRRKAD